MPFVNYYLNREQVTNEWIVSVIHATKDTNINSESIND